MNGVQKCVIYLLFYFLIGNVMFTLRLKWLHVFGINQQNENNK